MSAPDTNIEKQKRRHRPSLLGIWAALAAGAVIALLMIFSVLGDAEDEVNTTPAVSESSLPASPDAGNEGTSTETVPASQTEPGD